jgi:hypothetical protein
MDEILYREDTTGNRGTFVGGNKFVGTDKFILKYIHRYLKPTNICYTCRFGRGTNEYKEARFDFDQSLIFVGEVTSPTNICGLYSSVMWPHQ